MGALGTALDFGALNLTYLIFHMNLYVALTIGFIVGTTNNYLLNSLWTFRQKFTMKRFGQFALVGGLGLLLNNAIVYVIIEDWHLYYNLAKAIAVIIILLWNYFINKFWTFRRG